jgi:hypothetical protein
MLAEMFVEGVFLVSGVVKTVFCRFKKKGREFFCFSPRTKESIFFNAEENSMRDLAGTLCYHILTFFKKREGLSRA